MSLSFVDQVLQRTSFVTLTMFFLLGFSESLRFYKLFFKFYNTTSTIKWRSSSHRMTNNHYAWITMAYPLFLALYMTVQSSFDFPCFDSISMNFPNHRRTTVELSALNNSYFLPSLLKIYWTIAPPMMPDLFFLTKFDQPLFQTVLQYSCRLNIYI